MPVQYFPFTSVRTAESIVTPSELAQPWEASYCVEQPKQSAIELERLRTKPFAQHHGVNKSLLGICLIISALIVLTTVPTGTLIVLGIGLGILLLYVALPLVVLYVAVKVVKLAWQGFDLAHC